MTVTGTDLLVLGSGSLARALCLSLATIATQDIHVTVLARDGAAAEELAYLGNVRAGLAQRPVRLTGQAASLTDRHALEHAVGRAAIAVQCASWYSPWSAPPALKALVAQAGFGATLPLQARLAIETAQAIQRTQSGTLFVNACYPDAVNPQLARLGLPILCGIGNVATLAAGLSFQLGAAGRLKMLAHHEHLHAPAHPEDEALAWVDDVAVAEVGKLLAAQRRADRRRLNHITGLAGAQLVAALVTGEQMATHVPGPHGRPGGYPVRVHAGTISLDLPSGLDEAAATAWNERAGAREGVHLDDDLEDVVAKANRLVLTSRPQAQ